MGTFSIWHWLVVLAVVLLLFGGRGKISQLMGDFGKGLNAFKRGMREEGSKEDLAAAEPKKLEADTSAATTGPVQHNDPATKS